MPDTVILRDGRALAYAEYGAAGGTPAFYFHGTPGGLLEGRMLDDAARRAKVRLIAVDRPGYGGSDFKPNRRIIDWPDDVVDLADALGIEQFAVIGLSGGAPHAQACAAAMPDRVTSCVIVSGAGSPEAVLDSRRGIRRLFAKAILALAPLFAWWAAMWAAFWAPRMRPSMIPRWIDREVMRRADVRAALAEEVRQALRPGGRAMQQDLTLFARPFGFPPEDVGRVPVHVYHGDADKVVPVAIGRYYAREIPGARATFIPGGGHLLIVDHAAAVVGAAGGG